MPPSVTISSPSGDTPVPCTVSGTAQAAQGQTLCGMGYQVNTGPINSFPLPDAQGNWQFTLQTSDCPTVGQQYLLTVYAGESPEGDFSTDSDTIFRTQ